MAKVIHLELSEVEKAYLAGLIDGEGCLNFYRTSSSSCKRGYTFVARLTIVNCDLDTLVGIRERMGIGLVVKKPFRVGENRKQAYALSFYARELRTLLPLVMPYLRIKRRQADLLWQYLSSQVWGGSKKGIPEAEWLWRDVLHGKISALNRRGAPETVVN